MAVLELNVLKVRRRLYLRLNARRSPTGKQAQSIFEYYKWVVYWQSGQGCKTSGMKGFPEKGIWLPWWAFD